MRNRSFVLVFILVLFAAMLFGGEYVWAKRADLAGAWYSSSPEELKSELGKCLDDAQPGKLEGDVIGLIAPHAGFRFSGSIAAHAYNLIRDKNPSKVIIVGFTHRKFFPDSIAVFSDRDFETPLGSMRINMELSKRLIAYDENIRNIQEAFESENSIEMQIPFIQTVLKDGSVVLVSLCDQNIENCKLLAKALYETLKDEENFVILASTDMCHYLPYKSAQEKDKQTVDLVKRFNPEEFYSESLKAGHDIMCGYGAVYSVMSASKMLGADKVEVLKYANSGDTSGMRDRVVGYLSAAFIKSANVPEAIGEDKEGNRFKITGDTAGQATLKETGDMLNSEQKKELFKIARETIAHYLKTGEKLVVDVKDDVLKQDMGAFVTLHKDGQLRGCIGHMVATEPLYLTVRDMAIAAAVNDTRFSPVTLEELSDIDLEISVLSPMEKIADPDIIEMGKHGVMVRMGWRSGVYLPQVADETGWNRDQFMGSLCVHKAGIPADSWKTGACEIYVFTAEVFGETQMMSR
ncbi:MAG: AmmeMemoRadiSam system protein B [Candidatus Omnitrophota bacterium]